MNQEFNEFVRISALENAIGYKGTANPKALIGKVMPKFPEMKSDMKNYMQKINEIVTDVNSLGFDKQKEELLSINPNFFEQKEEKNQKKTGLPEVPEELKGKKLRTRFPPAPSGNLHLGHLFGLTYNYEYAKQSGGEMILRIEDTNPENISIENYEALIRDAQWVCDNNIESIYYQSDRVEIYYEYMEKLIESGHAYVCICDPEDFKNLVDSKEECPCRKLSVDEQKEKYEKFMNNGYEEGSAVIRFKGDINHKNPALRDFPIARIKKEKHSRVGDKYSVWPMYNLCCAIDDSILDISYIVRGKDLEIGGERQDMIKDALGLKKSPYFHYGRMKFTDLELSKTKITNQIDQGIFSGWDDIRVPSILAFKRQGYHAAAFRKLLVEMGMSKRDSKISKADYMKSLDFFNKEIIDPISKRTFCVFDSYNCEIENFSDIEFDQLEIMSHPNDSKLGTRLLNIEKNLFVEREDSKRLQIGDVIRLMHFANFEVVSNDSKLVLKFLSKEYSKDLKLKANIHFVFENSYENILMVNDENEKVEGRCEKLHELAENESLQFERFGFVKFDSIEDDKKVFYFTQK